MDLNRVPVLIHEDPSDDYHDDRDDEADPNSIVRDADVLWLLVAQEASIGALNRIVSEQPAAEIRMNCTRVIYRPSTVDTLGIIVAWLLIGLMITGSAALFWVSQR